MILDYNIERTYRAYFIVGSLDEIRSRVYEIAEETLPELPAWTFESDRCCWTYSGSARDKGYPINECLNVSFNPAPQGKIVGPDTFWRAEEAPILEIDAELLLNDAQPGEEASLTVTLTPLSSYDLVADTEQHSAPSVISVRLPVLADGTRNTWTVDLSQVGGYTGAFKSISIGLPTTRRGEIKVYSVRLCSGS